MVFIYFEIKYKSKYSEFYRCKKCKKVYNYADVKDNNKICPNCKGELQDYAEFKKEEYRIRKILSNGKKNLLIRWIRIKTKMKHSLKAKQNLKNQLDNTQAINKKNKLRDRINKQIHLKTIYISNKLKFTSYISSGFNTLRDKFIQKESKFT